LKYKIFKKSKSAMQSGIKNTKKWYLESMDINERSLNLSFDWSSSKNIEDQIKISFNDLQSAIDFAEKNNLVYEVFVPNQSNQILKSYSDNFKPKRK
tara:strand:+ start:142 stop:432 length:291 start_codon:yes stop_codon:yes gene_type:complete